MNTATREAKLQDTEWSLWQTAETTARRAGFGIAPDCASHLRGFIASGVARLRDDGRLGDDSALNETRANLVTFVERMVIEARTLNLTELHEPTFFRALSQLCPLWPFC